MHILLTGASGRIGSYTLKHLHDQGHTITAVDIAPLPPHVLPLPTTSTFARLDLTNVAAVENLFQSIPHCEAVIHLCGIPDPLSLEYRFVHNTNVTSSYNILRTAGDAGIKRIVAASSANAIGLNWTPVQHRWFNAVPWMREHHASQRMHMAYPSSQYHVQPTPTCSTETSHTFVTLHSDRICEVQADAMSRLIPDLRIASLRFHMARPTYQDFWPDVTAGELWGWVSYKSCAEACLLGITSEGWEGHEVFNITSPKLCWEGSVAERDRKIDLSGEIKQTRGTKWACEPLQRLEETKNDSIKVTSLELLQGYWPGTEVKEGWWTPGNERRGFWDTTKAEKLLGWQHDGH